MTVMNPAEALKAYREYCQIAAECRPEMNAPEVQERINHACEVLRVSPAELERDCTIAVEALLDQIDLDNVRMANPRVFAPIA